MNSYPLRIPISELPDETRLTIPRKAWTLWGTECKVIDIEGEFCRLEFYPEGEEIRRNQEVYVEIPGVVLDDVFKRVMAVYEAPDMFDPLVNLLSDISDLTPSETNDDDRPST